MPPIQLALVALLSASSNDAKALSGNLDKYLVTPAQVQTRAKVKLPEVPKVWLRKKPKTSWPLPDGCQQG